MKIKFETILDHNAIQHKIKRIAFQIYESNSFEDEVILAGISENGYVFAQRLAETLKNISPSYVQDWTAITQ